MNLAPLPGYAVSRDLIRTGDIVFIKNGHSIWSMITEFVTRSNVYHVGIAFWMREQDGDVSHLFLLESSKGGRRIVTLSSYEKHSMEVIEAPIDWRVYNGPFISKTGVIGYSIAKYVEIGLWELFKVKLKTGRMNEVCSKMVAEYINQDLELRGLPLLELNVSPGKLLDVLHEDLGCKTRLDIKGTP